MDLPNDLIESVAKGNCVLFVGSGLSVSAGMPSWARLLGQFVKEGEDGGLVQNGDDLRAEIDEGRFLEVAEYARLRLGPSVYSRVLRRAFSAPAEPTKNHEAIVDTRYRGVITTNYDKILETAYTLKWRRPPRTITWCESAPLGTVLYDKEFFIFKLHGDIMNPESIILTRRDYDEIMFRSPHVRTVLQAVLLTSTLLFVGYSISDPDFEMVMSEVPLLFGGSTATSYALLHDVSDAVVENYRNRMNVHVISYSPEDDHAAVTGALELLRDAAPMEV